MPIGSRPLDGVDYVTVGSRYVVGVSREFPHLGCTEEGYLEKMLAFVRTSELTDALKNHVLSQMDYVEYKGLSVVRIRVPAQSAISFLGDRAFIRENSSTVEASGKKLLAVNELFAQP